MSISELLLWRHESERGARSASTERQNSVPVFIRIIMQKRPRPISKQHGFYHSNPLRNLIYVQMKTKGPVFHPYYVGVLLDRQTVYVRLGSESTDNESEIRKSGLRNKYETRYTWLAGALRWDDFKPGRQRPPLSRRCIVGEE